MMWTRLRQSALTLSGQVFLLGALVIVVFAFFWQPLWVSTFCFDTCQPAPPVRTVTAWEFSLKGLAHWYVAPIPDTLVLIVVYFPLVASAVLLISSVVYLAHPSRTLMRWLTGVWGAGIVLLISQLLLIFFIIAQPDIGYWGIGLSYVLSGIGILLLSVSLRPHALNATGSSAEPRA